MPSWFTHFVPFSPVYLKEGRLSPSHDPIPSEMQAAIRLVLEFYGVPFRLGRDGQVSIPEPLSRDLDTLWNYTSKAIDPSWLAAHQPR
jgi:hypothetical protein